VLQLAEQRVAYVTDHEHACEQLSPTVLEAVRGVDILIHDAQYSRDELQQGKQGWGHSAWEDVVQLAQGAHVKQLFLFHHDPAATDEVLNERQFLAQQIFPQTFVAREGLKIPLHSVRSNA
jgi:ribonuclease BN (tRNA processing enzyme)